MAEVKNAERSKKVLEMGAAHKRPVIVARSDVGGDQSYLIDDEVNVAKFLKDANGNARYSAARFVPDLIIGNDASIADAVREFERFCHALTEYSQADTIRVGKADGTAAYEGAPAPAMPQALGENGVQETVPSYLLHLLAKRYLLAHQQDINGAMRDKARADAANPEVLKSRGINLPTLVATKGKGTKRVRGERY